MAAVAAGDVGEPRLAAVQPDGGAGQGHLAEIEGVAQAAHPTADEDQPHFRRAQRLIVRTLGQRIPSRQDLVGASLRQDGEPLPPLVARRFDNWINQHSSPPTTQQYVVLAMSDW